MLALGCIPFVLTLARVYVCLREWVCAGLALVVQRKPPVHLLQWSAAGRALVVTSASAPTQLVQNVAAGRASLSGAARLAPFQISRACAGEVRWSSSATPAQMAGSESFFFKTTSFLLDLIYILLDSLGSFF